MSKEEQSAYFSESERLTILHKVKYPYWSHQMNYVSIYHASYALLHWWWSIHRKNVFVLFRVRKGRRTKVELVLQSPILPCLIQETRHKYFKVLTPSQIWRSHPSSMEPTFQILPHRGPSFHMIFHRDHTCGILTRRVPFFKIIFRRGPAC